MSQLKHLLADLPADRQTRSNRRSLLDKTQWDEVLDAYNRGVSAKAIFAAASGVITPFFRDPKSLGSAINAEKAARKSGGGVESDFHIVAALG
jgi:hypothetical protein